MNNILRGARISLLFKIDLKMKLFILFLLVTLFKVNSHVYSQDTKITIDAKNATIEEIFEQIRGQSEFNFLFKNADIQLNRRVTVRAKNKPIYKVLNSIFKRTNIIYEVVGKQIILRPLNKFGQSQVQFNTIPELKSDAIVITSLQQIISGTVTDAQGVPLPGVNILIKGTSTGTQTDFDGHYNVSAKNGDVLQFSYVGYKSQDITIGNSKRLDVVLEEDLATLDEVVIVGFGTAQKKTSVVGAVSSVRPSELKIPGSNLTTALAGRIAGVISFQRSGEPGADNANFFVRGVTTFADGAGSAPLILIDGVELSTNDLARLHPDDIESFSVLKDATTTAVYGARGANGIIYVTTKKGKQGKPRISVRYENSLNYNTQLPEFSDAITYMQLYNEAVRTRTPSATVPFSEEKIIATQQGLNENVFPVTDWQDIILDDFGESHRFNFNINGGGEVVQYYVSGAYNHDSGILTEDSRIDADNNVNLNRFVFRSNISINISKSTTATLRFNSTLDRLTGPAIPGNSSSGANAFRRALLTSPVRFPAIYDADPANVNNLNILFGNQSTLGTPGGGANTFYINPLAELVSGFTRSSSAFSSVQIELAQDLDAITPGLKLNFRGNSNRTSSFSNSRNANPLWFFASENNYDRFNNTYELTPLNQLTARRTLQFNPGGRVVNNVLYGELALNYNRTFGEKHNVSGLLVGLGREFVDGNADGLQLALPRRNIGVSGRATYGYDNKYFAEFGFGYNGSERFDRNNRFGFFPSFGVGWTISEEKFFSKLKDAVSLFKLRASYGIVGSDAIGTGADRFFYLSQVNPSDGNRNYSFGRNFNNTTPGVSISRYENPFITWEVAKKVNFGVDLNLFNNSIRIAANYFTERREDILVDRVVPFSLGLQAPSRANLGIAETEGVDIELNVSHNFSNDFWITGRGTFTYGNGQVTRVEEEDFSALNAPFRSARNAKIGQAIGYIAERLFIDEEDVRNSPSQNAFGGASPGDIKYKDINGDGEISDLDRVPIGKPINPQLNYGFGFSLGYKNFDLSAFFQGVAETSIFIDPVATAPFNTTSEGGGVFPDAIGESPLLQAYANSFWSEDNRDLYAVYPRLSEGAIDNNIQTSTWWLRDGAFLRLKQIEIGWTLPTADKKGFGGMESLRLYLTGSNLLSWSKFDLWDPEVGGNGFGYPLQRVFNLGILANF